MGTPISSTHLVDGLLDGTSVTVTHLKRSSWDYSIDWEYGFQIYSH